MGSVALRQSPAAAARAVCPSAPFFPLRRFKGGAETEEYKHQPRVVAICGGGAFRDPSVHRAFWVGAPQTVGMLWLLAWSQAALVIFAGLKQ